MPQREERESSMGVSRMKERRTGSSLLELLGNRGFGKRGEQRLHRDRYEGIERIGNQTG